MFSAETILSMTTRWIKHHRMHLRASEKMFGIISAQSVREARPKIKPTVGNRS